MPIHDYACEPCGTSLRDFYLPLPSSPIPPCIGCGKPLERQWTTNRQHRTFEAFDFTLDGGKVVHVDNLATLRKIERESTDAYNAGVKDARPFIFRHYTQDQSNKDKSVFEHLRHHQVDPRTVRTQAGALMDSGFVAQDYQHKVHHATKRALADQTQRSRSRSR